MPKSKTLMRMNKGKTKFSLVDLDFFELMAKDMMFGIQKGYPENNWKLPVKHIGDINDSMLRHCIADIKGEFLDKESGLPHVVLMSINGMFKWYQITHNTNVQISKKNSNRRKRK